MIKGVWACLLAALLVSCNKQKEETPTRGSLSVAVCESQLAVLQLEAEEFKKIYPETDVRIVARSTREAIVALLNDSLKMICTDRQLNDEERSVVKQAGIPLTETKIAEDALAIIVHKTNPMKEIGFPSLKSIALGEVRTWSNVQESRWNGAIDLVLMSRNSGSYELLATRFLKTNKALAPTHEARTQQEIAQYVARESHAMGIVSISALRDSTLSLKTVAVQSQNPESPTPFVKLHQANVYRGYYPLHYSVYLYSTAQQSNVAFGFSAFVASAPGQKILLNAGLVPATMPIRLVQLN